MRHLLALASIALGLSAMTPALQAQGAPPMLTNDPDTPGNGHWELNFAAAYQKTDASRETALPIFDFNYGVGESIQLSYGIEWLSVRENGAPHQSGPSNSTAGLKWRFHDGGKTGASASVYPQIEFENPGSSSARKGLANRGATFTLPVQYERELGPLTFTGEVGRIFHFQAADEWFWGGCLGREISEQVKVGAELFETLSKSLDRSNLIVNLGTAVKVDEKNSFHLSVGRELHNHHGDRAKFLGYLGWQFRI